MAGSSFQFKQFTVHQQGAAMKVGTDGVLLGAWTPVDGCARILDIGTGTGLLALMCAQRNASAIIDAVEIDAAAVQQAAENFELSPWNHRLSVNHADIREFASQTQHRYDLVICNPPFFVNSLHAPAKERNMARHDVHLPLTDLATASVGVLNEAGQIAVVLPPDQMAIFAGNLFGHGFLPCMYLNILPVPLKPIKRVLGCFCKAPVKLTIAELIIETDGRHGYSPEYRNLTRDFYLAF